MAADFDFSNDWYYWGQNRLGSLLPLLASVFLKIIPVSPALMVSIVQYALLAGSFYLITYRINNHFIKIPLCIMWFFPLNFFFAHVLIGQPYSAQFFFLGLAVFVVDKWHSMPKTSYLKNAIYLFFTGLFLFLSAWASDLSFFIIPLFILYMLLISFNWNIQKNKLQVEITFDKYKSTINLISFTLGALFILICINNFKNNPADPVQYKTLFSETSHISAALNHSFELVGKAILFRMLDIPTSFIALFILFLLVLYPVSFLMGRIRFELISLFEYFLFFSAFVSFIICIASYWVEANEYNSRYFTFPFYMLVLFIAFRLVRLKGVFKHIGISAFFCCSLFSTINAIHFSSPEFTWESISYEKATRIINKLGSCGIIGDYWHSYVFASANPYLITATPGDQLGAVRKPELAKKCMNKRKIVLCKNDWLEEFPDTVRAFQYTLIRKGNSFKIEEMNFCEYKILK